MRCYTKGTLGQLCKWYGKILLKCAVVNAAVFLLATPAMALNVANGDTLTISANDIGEAVTNAGTLNLTGGTNENAITGTGTTVIDGTVTNTGSIQTNISILANKTLSSNGYNLGTVKTITNAGTLELTGGSITSSVNGTGNTVIKGDVVATTCIEQDVTVDSGVKLTGSFAHYLQNVENNGLLVLGGQPSVPSDMGGNITGTGTTTIKANPAAINTRIVNAGSHSISQSGLNITKKAQLNINADNLMIAPGGIIANEGILNLGVGTLTSAVTGAGETSINGDVIANASIANAMTVDGTNALTITADNVDNTIANASGTVNLGAGTLANAITGAGTTNITGDVTANASIANAISIDNGKILTIGASNVGNAVTNAGTLNLTGGTFTHGITGSGTTIFSGDVVWRNPNFNNNQFTIAEGGSLDIGTNEVIIDNNVTFNGTLKMEITDITKDSTVYTGGKLVTGATKFGNGSALSLTVAPNKLQKNESTGWLGLVQNAGILGGSEAPNFSSMLANNRYTVTADNGVGLYKITYTASVEDIVNEGNGNQNNINAGQAWDVLPTTGNPNTDNMHDKLNDLSQHNSGGYVRALGNLAPTEAQTALRITKEVNNLIGRQIERRQEVQGRNSGDVFKKSGMWFEGLANYAKQDGSSSSAGFTGKTAGFAFGVDGQSNEDTTLGLGLLSTSRRQKV